MSETKKVSKKEQAKKRNMRNTIIMAVLCVALISSATYAWFTLSKSAKISNLTLTVGEASGLMIAEETPAGKPAEYGSEIKLDNLATATGKLMPATLAKLTGDAYTVVKPVYDGLDIKNLATLEDSDTMTDSNLTTAGDVYCYEKPFYLLCSGSNLNVSLVGSAADGDGSWAKDADSPEYPASYALRIAFFSAPKGEAETLLGVWEPNSDSTFTVERTDKVKDDNIKYSADTLWSTAKEVGKDLSEKADGTFTKTSNNTSEPFITLQADKDTRIIMRVYFAGEDNECCNIIALNKILGQLKFTTETTP